MSKHHLHEPLQSAYKQYHSTETALIKVHNDIMWAMERQGVTILLLLDLTVRNRAGAATGGVGIVLSSGTKRSLASVTQHTDRTLAANFQGNPATTVIVIYCPTNVDNEDNIEAHYDNLRRTIDSNPAHNVLVIVGDFNGRVGTGDANYTYHDATNRNGKYMVDLAIEKNLIIANTYFRKRNGKLWTYMSPTGSKYQLDYVLIRKK
ncbi:craniofacial development protein 2-like [Amphiura filiformis]|uniref:craniofacial development protein 2-like n=1 Tax=Amphiura filiformis TaxID=82378 RepID=UPI003B225FD8